MEKKWFPPFISWGEFLDKIIILEIKSERMTDPAKLASVNKELKLLYGKLNSAFLLPEEAKITMAQLKAVNGRLWTIEDDIRLCEKRKDFGPKFVKLARGVYVTNDERARLKSQLNVMLGSSLKEEKSYQPYRRNRAKPEDAAPFSGLPDAARPDKKKTHLIEKADFTHVHSAAGFPV